MEKEESFDYLDGLNPPQREAVEQTDGPVMIIAGAGSGKTRVLTYRIAHLIRKGVDPFNIIALTFTNKAAREMRERIEKVVGPEAKNLWMGTFHSIFAKILRIEADKLGYPGNFTIYDSDDSKSLLKTIIKEMGLDDKVYKPNMVLGRISNAKNNLISPEMYNGSEDLVAYDGSTGRPHIAEIYTRYAQRCFKSGAMDFDDLLLNTYKLFTKHIDALNKYQQKFKYVMVDEYQDTNHCQYMIVKKLAAAYENICVVGDDAQSIYSFRGATIKNILSFENDYPDLKVFKLEQNYRSTNTIVQAANGIISNNKEQLDKSVWTDNQTGNKIKLIRAVTDNEEGKFIAQSIFEYKMHNQLSHNHFAILYRTNAQSRSLEEALRKLNIPYRIFGGLSFYQRKEIKDIIAYLRLAVNPNDEEALKRIINYPTRGIGKTTQDRLLVRANEEEKSMMSVVASSHLYPELSSATAKLQAFTTMIKSFRIKLESENAYEVAMHVVKSTGILKTLNADKTIEGVSRYENAVELLNGIKEFVEDDTSELEKTLSVYLQDIALLTDRDKDDPTEDKVSLMTVHMAKGLEFPYVYISGMEENLFPSQMSLGSRKELEEERRLFYVAVTRAETNLTLSFSTSRFRFGTLLPCEPSRFIDEIDKSFIEMDKKMLSQKPLGTSGKQPYNKDEYGRGYGRSVRTSKSKPTASSRKTVIPPTAKPAPIENFVAEPMDNLMEGQRIEHQRFGKGTVAKIDGEGPNTKANIEFDHYGAKTLVLKFAKLRLVKD